MKRKVSILIGIALALGAVALPSVSRAQIPEKSGKYMALKTNVAYDAFAIHNLAFEWQCSRSVTMEVPVIWSLWDIAHDKGIRGVAIQPEVRWWTKKAGQGHYVGIHAHGAWFNVKWKDTRYQSVDRPLLGGGLTYGYKLNFNSSWGADFYIGAGYANMKYNSYYNIPNGAQKDTHVRHYWGLTRVGASLVYHF